MAGKRYYVAPNDSDNPRAGDWKVQRQGASRAYSTHDKKRIAVREGKKVAKKQNVGLVVKGDGGKIQYGYTCDTSGSRAKLVKTD